MAEVIPEPAHIRGDEAASDWPRASETIQNNEDIFKTKIIKRDGSGAEEEPPFDQALIFFFFPPFLLSFV